MIPRRWSRLFFLILFLLMVLILYNMLQSIGSNRIDENDGKVSIHKKIDELSKSINEIDKSLIENERKQDKVQHQPVPAPPTPPIVEKTQKPIPEEKTTKKAQLCPWRNSPVVNTTIEIRQLYEKLPFDDVDGGVWKQGFPITYQESQWNSEKKLKIILMPHSHCDPGWLQTFEEYFSRATKNILDTVITSLNSNPKYRFVWAEMSFLSLWWDQASIEQKDLFRKLLSNGQLEIVTGGWVMNDEANTHYFAMIDQLIEGHQFIQDNIGNVTIRAGWANDPFGYSPTMTYLLKSIGLEYMTIQRVHYHVKKELAKTKQFEFYWQQTWDRDASTRILTHMMPFYSYDVPHTCGPDPKVCCQFDFRRAAGSDMYCPWGINPIPITESNVRERAGVLLDQYRKKAQLFRTNVLFVPLGDDFRYVTMKEAEAQFENYDKLFNYMNSQSDWHVEARFGTLSEYFKELQKSVENNPLPSYMGDFFTYADRVDHYWSGYYTSRSFFKRMDRIVESYLRASEILFSTAHVRMLESEGRKTFPAEELFKNLVKTRRNLGVFQHHDGVTGTAKEYVVNDYGEKLFTAIKSAQNVLEQSASYLLYADDFSANRTILSLNEDFDSYQSLPKRKVLSLSGEEKSTRIVYLYNPTDQRRKEIVRLVIDKPTVSVSSDQKAIRSCQIDPHWSGRKSNKINTTLFELSIFVDVEAYSLKEYTIQLSTEDNSCPLSTIEYFNEKDQIKENSGPFKSKRIDDQIVRISNKQISLSLKNNGKFVEVHHLEHDEKISFDVTPIHYGTSRDSDRNSGAYLFIPDGEAREIPMGVNDIVRIQRGPLSSRVEILHEMFALQLQLSETMTSNDQSIEIFAHTHLQIQRDFELALRITTSIKNGDEFFTDLNGFQTIRRKTYSKLPIQGNVYPMPSMAYLEDDHVRLTVLSGQPSGVASLKSGVVDVFLDRRLLNDDNRGLGHGVTDNRPILSHFKLLFEARRTVADRTSLTGYPTLRAHHQSIELLYPIHILESNSKKVVRRTWNLFSKLSLFPSDYHLVNLRTLPVKGEVSKSMGMVVRRFAYDCEENYDSLFNFEEPVFEHFFSSQQIASIDETSLTLTKAKQNLGSKSKLNVPLAELKTFRIQMK